MRRAAFQGVVFDLDGVVTKSASLHAESWKRMFDGFLGQRAQSAGRPLEPFRIDEDYRRYVDGRPRIEGVQTFLRSRDIELPTGESTDEPGFDTAWALGNLKNKDFTELVQDRGVEVLSGTVRLIEVLRARGVRVGVASSSKNCSFILRSAGLEQLFEVRVDGVVSEELELKGKPAPDIFLEAARQLGVDPGQSVVVEDATSGVAAGKAGAFGLVIGIGPEETHLGLREHGADWIVESFDESSYDTIESWFEQREHRLPSALGERALVERVFAGRHVALFLDYDGTLTPIVSRPELAILSPAARETLREVATAIPTSIISGRGRPDVEKLVGIGELAYAGSHGFDIIGRNREPIDYKLAPWIADVMDKAAEDLRAALGTIKGCIVEHKTYSVATHYRMVAEDALADIESAVDTIVESDPRLAKATGKKVFEIRPALDWDKGKALVVLEKALGLSDENHVPIYIGDDVTDEDAFRELKARGVGILVSETPRSSDAHFWLQHPGEVFAFLARLLEYERRERQ